MFLTIWPVEPVDEDGAGSLRLLEMFSSIRSVGRLLDEFGSESISVIDGEMGQFRASSYFISFYLVVT